jgi:hypothetical protein
MIDEDTLPDYLRSKFKHLCLYGTNFCCIPDNAQQMMPQMVQQPFLPMQEAMATVTDTSQPPPNTNAMPTGNPLAMVPPFSLPRKSVF